MQVNVRDKDFLSKYFPDLKFNSSTTKLKGELKFITVFNKKKRSYQIYNFFLNINNKYLIQDSY